MHSVFEWLLKGLSGRGGSWRDTRSLGESWRNLFFLFTNSKPGAVQPQGHSVQDGGPGAAVMEPCCVYSLWRIKRSTWKQIKEKIYYIKLDSQSIQHNIFIFRPVEMFIVFHPLENKRQKFPKTTLTMCVERLIPSKQLSVSTLANGFCWLFIKNSEVN